MRIITTVTALIIALYLSAFAQLLVKNSSDVTMMQVTSSGTLGIGIGDTAPAATLDVGGDVHIATVNDLTGTGNASVLVLDNGMVKKRTLPEEIWNGDDGEVYTAGAGINISSGNEISADDTDPTNELQDLGSSKSGESVTVTITGGSNTSFSVRDGDYLTNNETPQSGNATSISGRTVNVLYDNSTIRLNGSNQLYVDQLPASAGWTFYNAQQMLIECGGNCTSGQFFTWYNRSQLGIPSTAQAVYVHTALSDDGGSTYNLTVSELSWNDNNTDLNNAIDNGAFLTATINDTRPGHNAGIVKLHSNGLWVGLRNLGTSGVPNFVRIKVLGYLQ